MRARATVSLLAALLVAGLAAAPASAEFGFKEFDVYFAKADGTPAAEAGSHPFAVVTNLAANTKPDPTYGEVPDDEVKDLDVSLPAGFAGSPTAVPRCATEDFVRTLPGDAQSAKSSLCPDATAIGEVAGGVEKPGYYYHAPVYNLVPDPGTAAKFGFVVLGVPVTIDSTLSPDYPNNIVVHVGNINQTLRFYSSRLTIWGNPSDPLHDPVRGSCVAVFEQDTSRETPSRGTCPYTGPKTAFLTMPRSCVGPLATAYRADSWQNPGTYVTGSSTSHDDGIPPAPIGISGCEGLGFSPTIAATTTSTAAASPSGLDFNLDVNGNEGLKSPTGRADSDIKKTVVTLPEGLTANAAVAAGLATCSPAQYAAEQIGPAGCPPASKLGSVEVETPLLEGALLRGQVFAATPDDPATAAPGAENPFDTLIALYMVVEDEELGVLSKLAGRVDPDPVTGQLTTTFDQIPQIPLAHVRFHFKSGARAPLATPRQCGTYTVSALFTPWARPDRVLPATSQFPISSACPSGPPPFAPGFAAGSINNDAAAYSPFYMRLTRTDPEQALSRLSATLPPGVTGKLAGVVRCPEEAIAAAKGKSGRSELASPSCPPGSEIATTLAGAGVGPELTYVGGSVYLAGPFAGAPLSAVSITPAVAGPFDVGTVVVRVGLDVDRTSAQVQIEGQGSDPIPQILEGIPLQLRDLRIFVDRERFALNPTNCDESSAAAALTGSEGTVAQLSTRYQAAGCAGLGFKPKLQIKLSGAAKRNTFPALKATYSTPAKGTYANLRRAAVTMPRSAFIEQAHIRTICTRVQFAADNCPAASIYGNATAYTPLLAEPLKGPVYLRSSSNPLPDLVADLHGLVDFELAGRIDSVKGRLRTTFPSAPDVPVSKFVLSMQGGKKGLIVNSENLCSRPQRAKAALLAQNGKPLVLHPAVKSGCGQKKGR